MKAVWAAKKQRAADEQAIPAGAQQEAIAEATAAGGQSGSESAEEAFVEELENSVVFSNDGVVEVFAGAGVDARRQADRDRQLRSRRARASAAQAQGSLQHLFGWVRAAEPHSNIESQDTGSEGAAESSGDSQRPRANGEPRGRPPRLCEVMMHVFGPILMRPSDGQQHCVDQRHEHSASDEGFETPVDTMPLWD